MVPGEIFEKTGIWKAFQGKGRLQVEHYGLHLLPLLCEGAIRLPQEPVDDNEEEYEIERITEDWTPVEVKINKDPAGIKALLEQLRSSQAWQESITVDRGGGPENPPSSSTTSQAASNIVQPPAPTSDVSNPSSSVAALLSQLNSSEWVTPSRTPQPQPASYFSMQQTSARSSQPASQPNPQPSENIVRHPVAPSIGARASTLGLGLRMMSFQQALPHLTELAENTGFVASISQLREEQKDLEKQLWEERLAIQKKHENKVKVAQTKAALIGAGISQHEADMMNDAFRKELQKFDAERVLFAWDGLLQKQQSSLEALGVPTMFPTDLQADREKQQKVVHVLEGIVG